MFEWDPKKASVNLTKHGVSFEDASTVFADPNAMDGGDLQHSAGELRFSPARTVEVGHGLDGRVHFEEYRKWRNDPNHQRAASEPEGKSGVREHGGLISLTFQRLLRSSSVRCDASDVLRSADRRVNLSRFVSIRE